MKTKTSLTITSDNPHLNRFMVTLKRGLLERGGRFYDEMRGGYQEIRFEPNDMELTTVVNEEKESL